MSIQKQQMIKKTRQLSNVTYSVIGTTCTNILVVKTLCRNTVLPAVLYGANVTKKQVGERHPIENGVY